MKISRPKKIFFIFSKNWVRISPLQIIWAVNNGHPFKNSDTERLKPPVFDIDREYNHYDSGSLILTLSSNINNYTKF